METENINWKEIQILKCKKCGHVWATRRRRRPKVCPMCKDYFWDQEK